MMLVPFLSLQWALLGLAPINKDITVTYGQCIMQVVNNVIQRRWKHYFVCCNTSYKLVIYSMGIISEGHKFCSDFTIVVQRETLVGAIFGKLTHKIWQISQSFPLQSIHETFILEFPFITIYFIGRVYISQKSFPRSS